VSRQMQTLESELTKNAVFPSLFEKATRQLQRRMSVVGKSISNN